MHILLITASTNDPSNSATLADAFMEGAQEACECDVQQIRLADFPLPQFTVECYGESCNLPEGYLKLKEMVQKADGVLIATPVWNFGVPALLKNFIDWTGVFGLDQKTHSKGQLGGKPFYFIFTGGAPAAAWKGLMRFTTMFVRESVRYFGGTVVGLHYEGHCTQGAGKFGLVVDRRPESLARVKKQGAKFAMFADDFRKTKTLPLRYRLFERAYLFGQRVVSKF